MGLLDHEFKGQRKRDETRAAEEKSFSGVVERERDLGGPGGRGAQKITQIQKVLVQE